MNNFQGITIKKEPNNYDNYGTENLHDDEDPGSRCGEIYVGNNARKWTFICTFCDKSVREIDEFISHIKFAHVNLPPPLPVGLSEAAHSNETQPIEHNNSVSMKNEVPLFNPLDKTLPEYVDYNDFLDVNVQTVPEVILSDNHGHMEVPVAERAQTTQSRIKREPISNKEHYQPRKTAKKSSVPAVKPVQPPVIPVQPAVIPVQPEVIPEEAGKPRRQRKGRSRRKQIKGPAFCQICKRTFQYHSLYRNHMVKHTSETPFTCTICNKGFKSKQAIRYHMTTHQREKPFKCELCEAGFYHEWQFVSHMETHKNENNHPCEVCGKVNRTKFDKDIHMRTHTGDRPFACEFCSKRFRLRHHLSNHLKLHLTYRCDFCRTQFSNGVPLKKPYACPDCYADANSMQIHGKEDEEESNDSDDEEKDVTFHPLRSPRDLESAKPHTCKICHKVYANKRGLSVHNSTKHITAKC